MDETKQQTERQKQIDAAIAVAYRKIAAAVRKTGKGGAVKTMTGGAIESIGGTPVGGMLRVSCRNSWWALRQAAKDVVPLGASIETPGRGGRTQYFRTNKSGDLPSENIATKLLVAVEERRRLDAKHAANTGLMRVDEITHKVISKRHPKFSNDRMLGKDKTVQVDCYGRLELTVKGLSRSEWFKVCKLLTPFCREIERD